MYFVYMPCYAYVRKDIQKHDDSTNAYFPIKEENLLYTNGILMKLQPFAACDKLRKIYKVQRKKGQRVQDTNIKGIPADPRGRGV
jgi:hypothetical protein